MLMADTMAIFFVILGLLLAFPGLWLLCRGLWPDLTAGANARCQAGLVKPFLTGLPITAAMLIVSIALGRLAAPAAKIASVGIICIYNVYAHTGVSGLATFIGGRLPSPADAERPWGPTLRGGIVLELSYLLPILGWFFIWPASVIIGCGAATLALFQREPKATPVRIPVAPGPGDTAMVRPEGPVGAPQ